MSGSNGITTSIEPPGLGTVDDEDEPPVLEIHVGLAEGDGTTRVASASLPINASDVDIAFAVVNCVHGLASMRGPGLRSAIQRWVPFQ